MMDLENETTDANERDAVSDLQHLCEAAFDGEMDATALALGREGQQLEDMIAADEAVDEDQEMKIHAVGEERGIKFA